MAELVGVSHITITFEKVIQVWDQLYAAIYGHPVA
jgi:hypothetical protein